MLSVNFCKNALTHKNLQWAVCVTVMSLSLKFRLKTLADTSPGFGNCNCVWNFSNLMNKEYKYTCSWAVLHYTVFT